MKKDQNVKNGDGIYLILTVALRFWSRDIFPVLIPVLKRYLPVRELSIFLITGTSICGDIYSYIHINLKSLIFTYMYKL